MFVVYDLETTGLSEINDDIIEFAYIAFDDNCNFIQSEQLFFYHRGMSWSEDAYKVHHISLDFLETQADKFKENLLKMYAILNHNNVVGYNNNHFDNPFVKTWLMRQGIRNLEFKVTQDVMLAYRPIYKKSKIKLTRLSDMMGYTPELINRYMDIYFPQVGNSQAHEAAYDVVATALLTLSAIPKHLIAFKSILPESHEAEDVMTDMLFVNENTSTASMVRFTLRDTFGATEIKTLPYIDPKINEHGPILVEIPVPLESVDDSVYELAVRGSTISYNTNTPDKLTLCISGTNLNLLDLDIDTIIKSNFN